jgi:transcriptional regulator with XRE-family HTH domain
MPQQITNYKTAHCQGEVLRMLRLCRNCKQQAVAKQLGISQQALSKLENAPLVPPERVAAVLRVLNCTEADLEYIRRLMPNQGP